MILAIETSCDDTCAAVVDRGGEMRSNVISSQGVHDRYGGVVPEIAARHHLELHRRRRRRRAGAGAGGARRRLAGRGHAGARAGRRAAGRHRHGQGAGRRPAAAAGRGRPPPGPRRRELPRAGALRAAVPVPDRVGRPHAAGARSTTRAARGARARRSTTRPARRSTRARACSGCRYRAGPALESWPRERGSRARTTSRRAQGSRGSTSPSPG